MQFTMEDVAQGRALVLEGVNARLALGDLALKIAPMQQGARNELSQKSAKVPGLLAEFADAIGETARKVELARTVAHFYRGVARRRKVEGVSWSILVEAMNGADGDPAEALASIAKARGEAGIATLDRLRTVQGRPSTYSGRVRGMIEQASPETKGELFRTLAEDPDLPTNDAVTGFRTTGMRRDVREKVEESRVTGRDLDDKADAHKRPNEETSLGFIGLIRDASKLLDRAYISWPHTNLGDDARKVALYELQSLTEKIDLLRQAIENPVTINDVLGGAS
jgi:hypothetical protein